MSARYPVATYEAGTLRVHLRNITQVIRWIDIDEYGDPSSLGFIGLRQMMFKSNTSM